MKNRNYNCTQQELYTMTEQAWQSAMQHLVKFTAFKPKYDAAFLATRITELESAMNLPTEDERNSKSAILRLKLTDANRSVLNKFQDLKSHIADAFPPHFQNQHYIAAGQNHYDKASGRNWDSTRALITLATHFITENIAALTADQNMSPAFQTEFQNEADNFALLHKQFIDSEESATIGTEEKIIMNNNIYNELKKLFRDGQKIFRYQDAIRKQFTFSDLIYLLSGAGTAGLRGIVTNENNSMPISNALITIVQTNETAVTSDEGKYQISPMAHGTYSIRIVAEGYQEKLVPAQEVLVGTISSFDIHLLPAA